MIIDEVSILENGEKAREISPPSLVSERNPEFYNSYYEHYSALAEKYEGFPGSRPTFRFECPKIKFSWKKFLSLFPIRNFVWPYSRQKFQGDLIAGLTVGVILVPQAMAYAQLASLPAIYGLYAVLAPSFIYAALGTSPHLSVGPFAIISLLVSSAVTPLADPKNDTERYMGLVFMLSIMVGVILFVMWLLRLGFLASFLSDPVLIGFTSASAILIAASQFEHLFGITLSSDMFPVQVEEILENIGHVNYQSMLFGLICFGFLLGFQRINSKYRKGKLGIPGSLIVVAFSILVQHFAQFDIEVIGNIPQGVPGFNAPKITAVDIGALAGQSLIVALLTYLLTISVAKTIAQNRGYKGVDSNQELLALAVGNFVGGFTYAYPCASSLTRSNLAAEAGAETPIHGVISCLLVIIVLEGLTSLLRELPSTVLASIVFIAVLGIINVQEPRHLWRKSRPDFWMWALAFLSTLIFGVVPGITISVSASLILILKTNIRPTVTYLGLIKQSPLFWDISRNVPAVENHPQIKVVRYSASLNFANKLHFQEVVLKECNLYGDQEDKPVLSEETTSEVQAVVVDGSNITSIDISALSMLTELAKQLQSEKILFLFANLEGSALDVLNSEYISSYIPRDRIFPSIFGAFSFAEACIRDGIYRYFPSAEHKESPSTTQDSKERIPDIADKRDTPDKSKKSNGGTEMEVEMQVITG